VTLSPEEAVAFEALDAKILIVDADRAVIGELERILADAAFHRIESTTEPRETLYFCGRFRPDVLLLDLGATDPGAEQILRDLQEREADFPAPAVVGLTSGETLDARRRLVEAGLQELLRKPLDPLEVALRVRGLVERRRQSGEGSNGRPGEVSLDDLREHAERAELSVLHILARLVEYRDFKTEQHAERVGELSARVATELGLTDEEVGQLRDAAPLHDVGMIVVPDRILLKSGQLDEDERKIMMTHATNGAQILSVSELPVMKLAREIAYTHHERWDGTGYPRGLSGEEIPLCGRIVAVADAFEAITHDRPFREAESAEEAMEELRRERGRQFDPEVVDAALKVVEREGAIHV
jgi:putative two-component system response regulator